MFHVRVFLVAVFTMILSPCLGGQFRSGGRGIKRAGHGAPRSQQPVVMRKPTDPSRRFPVIGQGIQDGRTEHGASLGRLGERGTAARFAQ